MSMLAMPSGPGIAEQITRASAAAVDAARQLPVATLHEASGRIGAMPHQIKPVAPAFRLCGPAVMGQVVSPNCATPTGRA